MDRYDDNNLNNQMVGLIYMAPGLARPRWPGSRRRRLSGRRPAIDFLSDYPYLGE